MQSLYSSDRYRSECFRSAALLQSFESVICADIAHIQYQETGACEAFIGCKLLPVQNRAGKVTPGEIIKKLKRERAFGKHSTSPRVLSIAQPTEIGTVYTLEELKALSKLYQEENLLLHIDGSRLYNAAVYLKVQRSFAKANAARDIDSRGFGNARDILFNMSLDAIYFAETFTPVQMVKFKFKRLWMFFK